MHEFGKEPEQHTFRNILGVAAAGLAIAWMGDSRIIAHDLLNASDAIKNLAYLAEAGYIGATLGRSIGDDIDRHYFEAEQ